MYKRIPVSGKYRFQRGIIVLAAVLWLITVVRILSKDIVREVSAGSSTDMVSVFCDSVYTDVTSEITAYGGLTESYLSEDAKKMLLCDMAEDIGLNAYRLEKTEDNTEYALVQNSVYGDVSLKIIYSQEKYYLIINMQLDKGIESTMAYRGIIQDICDRYGVDCSVNAALSGAVNGNIGIEERNALCEKLLTQLRAKEVQSRKTMDMFVVYAYDRYESSYVMLGKNKVNVNISMEYDENNDMTVVHMAVPVYIEK